MWLVLPSLPPLSLSFAVRSPTDDPRAGGRARAGPHRGRALDGGPLHVARHREVRAAGARGSHLVGRAHAHRSAVPLARLTHNQSAPHIHARTRTDRSEFDEPNRHRPVLPLNTSTSTSSPPSFPCISPVSSHFLLLPLLVPPQFITVFVSHRSLFPHQSLSSIHPSILLSLSLSLSISFPSLSAPGFRRVVRPAALIVIYMRACGACQLATPCFLPPTRRRTVFRITKNRTKMSFLKICCCFVRNANPKNERISDLETRARRAHALVGAREVRIGSKGQGRGQLVFSLPVSDGLQSRPAALALPLDACV